MEAKYQAAVGDHFAAESPYNGARIRVYPKLYFIREWTVRCKPERQAHGGSALFGMGQVTMMVHPIISDKSELS